LSPRVQDQPGQHSEILPQKKKRRKKDKKKKKIKKKGREGWRKERRKKGREEERKEGRNEGRKEGRKERAEDGAQLQRTYLECTRPWVPSLAPQKKLSNLPKATQLSWSHRWNLSLGSLILQSVL
jgi:flagellar biosynthesis/type III secretory pathway protein FliH